MKASLLFSKGLKTALIFACGTSINEHKDYIPSLIDKYTSVGVNRFPSKFAEYYAKDKKSMPVDYWIYSDTLGTRDFIIPYYDNQKILMESNIPNDVKILKDKNISVHLIYHGVSGLGMIKEGKYYLGGLGTTTLHAISFLYLVGFKNIVIFGMDNKVNDQGVWEHFYHSSNNYKTQSNISKINNQLEDYKEYVNLYKASNSSNINLDVVTIKEGEVSNGYFINL